MFRRVGLDLARHAVEAFRQQLAQRPAGAVAGQHVEVMDMQVAVAMRLPGFGAEDVRQPVVGRDLAGDIEDQSAQAVALVGVGAHAPVALGQVFLHGAGHVDLAAGLGRRQRAGLLCVAHAYPFM
ncbi:hypothetical protein D3C72_1544670 [compost metagenome]